MQNGSELDEHRFLTGSAIHRMNGNRRKHPAPIELATGHPIRSN